MLVTPDDADRGDEDVVLYSGIDVLVVVPADLGTEVVVFVVEEVVP